MEFLKEKAELICLYNKINIDISKINLKNVKNEIIKITKIDNFTDYQFTALVLFFVFLGKEKFEVSGVVRYIIASHTNIMNDKNVMIHNAAFEMVQDCRFYTASELNDWSKGQQAGTAFCCLYQNKKVPYVD